MIQPPQGSELEQAHSLDSPETEPAYNALQSSPNASLAQSDQFVFERKKSVSAILRVTLIGVVVLLLLAAVTFFLLQRWRATTALQADNFNEVHLSLKEIEASSALSGAQTLKVDGQLQVSSSLMLFPSGQPKNPVSGQIYFDEERKQMLYYDGAQFVLLQGGTGPTINNISNVATGGSTVTNVFNNTTNTTNTTNTSGGGPTLTGTAGSLAMFTGSNSLGNSLIQQTGTTLQVATSGTNTVTVGSSSSTSSTAIQGGTGGTSISTGSGAGVTGSLSITTGDSSTTASGNITIDSGAGIIDGEVIEDKTFESGLDNMQDWFNTSLATTTAQAHSGLQSLQVTPSSTFWGVIEVFPGTPVTPGHQYHFSIWLRAATTPRTITAKISWQGSGIVTSFTPAVDSTTGWTETTLTAPAPAGATSAAFEIQTSSGAAGDIHYMDDITITDLSSGTAISSLDIGSTNAKVITIGNLNQIGATTIRGGSGVTIQSGAASTVINGGTLNLTGNAASSLNTTSGALTIISAATTSWGISTASSGVGGDLTLHAGKGGSDTNNDGGDLFLQGGARNGTGAPGSVIVKPPTDVADAFQIQNSSGAAFLVADSSNKKISITGLSGSFATLLINNGHFASTQTTAPTISAPTNCGTSPSAAVTAGSTDAAGSFSITTGSGSSATTCDATVTFNAAYGSTPKSIIVVGKTDAASAARQTYVSNSSATTFTTAFGASAGGANGTTYTFSYWVIE